MYGTAKETRDYRVRCEMCGKFVESKKRIEVYGPDMVQWGDEKRKRPHWFDKQSCADEYTKNTKEE